jgi:hypothetical protein
MSDLLKADIGGIFMQALGSSITVSKQHLLGKKKQKKKKRKQKTN